MTSTKKKTKRDYSRCTKFDADIEESQEALAKNCEECLKVNKKCLVES